MTQMSTKAKIRALVPLWTTAKVVASISLASAILVDTALGQQTSKNDSMSKETVSRIADAIFRAEGTHSKHPYGVTIPCTSPRMVCINTVTHAWRDFERENNGKMSKRETYDGIGLQRSNFVAQTRAINGTVSLPFIQFLGSRYCPPTADPQGFKNWTNNVWKIIQQERKTTTK